MLLLLLGAGHFGAAQSTGRRAAGPAADRGAVSLALTFDSAGANITTANSFWLTGGSAELNAGLFRGLGVSASITGLHAGNSGQGVPVNLVVETFGPSYSLRPHFGRRATTLFFHGLVGEANGFKGLYPKSNAPGPSANGFAAKVGGALDLTVSRHISLRCVEADWLRTELPNSTTNVQNDLQLGAGILFRSAPR